MSTPKKLTQSSWSQVDIFAPDVERFPLFEQSAFQEVRVRPGELLLIPRHWWHAVENLGLPTLAVSFFVDPPEDRTGNIFYEDRKIIAGLAARAGLREAASQ